MFICGVKINYITVWSNPTMFLTLPAEPHVWPLPVGRLLSLAVEMTDASKLGAQQDAGLRHGCPKQATEVSIFLPTSALQALRDQRFESKLASETCYSRGGREGDLGIITIIHEHKITEAVQGEHVGCSVPHQDVNVHSSHHSIITGNVTCHSLIQCGHRGSVSDGSIRLPLLED